MNDEYIWEECYRPKTVKECILPVELKKLFQGFVDSKKIPNMTLTGTQGTGKTTVARAMLDEIGADYIFINGSLDGSIDTLRNEIPNFASSVSFTGGRKYIILDEADHLSNAFMDALRGFTDEFASNVSFILTCNFINKIISPLQSRCPVIEFKIPVEEREKLALKFYKKVQFILEDKKIEYDPASVAALITRFFPDWRRVIGELQKYSINGKIDSGILANLRDSSVDTLIVHLKKKNFKEVRKWAAEQNSDVAVIFRQLYDESEQFLKEESIPQLILYIAKYQDMASHVADQEINLVAFLVECMIDLEYK